MASISSRAFFEMSFKLWMFLGLNVWITERLSEPYHVDQTILLAASVLVLFSQGGFFDSAAPSSNFKSRE